MSESMTRRFLLLVDEMEFPSAPCSRMANEVVGHTGTYPAYRPLPNNFVEALICGGIRGPLHFPACTLLNPVDR